VNPWLKNALRGLNQAVVIVIEAEVTLGHRETTELYGFRVVAQKSAALLRISQ
jgi:hypothetical protein